MKNIAYMRVIGSVYQMSQRKALLCLFITFTFLMMVSCGTYESYREKGEFYSDMMRYNEASKYYSKAIDKKKATPEDYLRLADIYLKLGKYDKNIETLLRLDQEKTMQPENYKPYARALMMGEQYASAINYFDSYLQRFPNDKVVQDWKASCEKLQNLKKNPEESNFELVKLKIDGFQSTFSPVVKDGFLYFSGESESSKKSTLNPFNEKAFTDIFKVAVEKEFVTGTPESMNKNLTEKLNVGVPSFDPVNEKVYFSCNQVSKSNKKAVYDESESSNIGIYVADIKKNGKWDRITKLSFIKKEYNYMHPTISTDGKTLYFAADIPGGFGGMDIYYSKKIGNAWSSPVNLGATINTKENEAFPFLYNDTVLYFSSSAHENYGGLDILKSAISEDGGFSNPENLGPYFNSRFDDFGINIDGQGDDGYFSSNRDGEDAIYYFKNLVIPEKEEPLIAVNKEEAVTVQSREGSGSTTAVTRQDNQIKPTYTLFIRVRSAIDSSEISDVAVRRDRSVLLKTDESGYLKLDLPTNGSCNILIQKAGYVRFMFNVKSSINCKESSVVDLDVFLVPESSSSYDPTVIVLKGIYYDFNKFNINRDAAKELNVLVDLMKKYPSISIELSSHTDSRGSYDYNMNLSRKRSEAAVNYIVNHGVSRNRIQPNYFGKGKLIRNCPENITCPEEVHRINRRTEIKVLEYDPSKISLDEIKMYFEKPDDVSYNGVADEGITIERSGTEFTEVKQKEYNHTTTTTTGKTYSSKEYRSQESNYESKSYSNTGKSQKYCVIAASYSGLENAKKYQDKLVSAGFKGVEVLYDNVIARYRIVMGSFDTMADAQSALQKYKAKMNISDMWILKLK